MDFISSGFACRRRVLPVAAATVALALGWGAAAAAQGSRVFEAWHTVRPGETLRGITALYLGSEERWVENWRLNPTLPNPDLLVPGQRIRVLQEMESAVPSARITSLSGRVEGSPAPIPWTPAQQDDLLLERDGLRTFEDSSSVMSFPDGTSVQLSEESLVFLRRAGRGLTEAEPRTVEIVDGQAEIEARTGSGAEPEVEILIGNTRATSKLGADGVSQARARRDEEGAKVMVYEGEGAVENAGATVALPRGTGSAVPKEGPPAPAEKLLPAPAPGTPADASEWQYPNPRFSWQPVDGAAGYAIEVCADAACLELVRKTVLGPEPEWQSEPLPVARHYWRVTAVSPTGLDGYPSSTHRFDILSDTVDNDPPSGSIRIVGNRVDHPSGVVWQEVERLEVEVEDAVSGVEGWTVTLNGEEIPAERLAGPWESGEYAVEVRAVDRFGNAATLGPSRFRIDHDPPVIRFEVGDAELLRDKIGSSIRARRIGLAFPIPPWALREPRPRHRQGPEWTALAWAQQSSPLGDNYVPREWPEELLGRYRYLEVRGDRPAIVLSAPGLEVPAEAGGHRTLDRDEVIWLEAEDEHGGTVLRLVVRDDPYRAADRPLEALVLQTEDVLGNRGTVRWPFR